MPIFSYAEWSCISRIMVRHFFLTLYDHLGHAVLLNLLWVVASVPWFVGGWAIVWTAAVSSQALAQPLFSGVGFVAAGGLIVFSPPTLFVCVATHAWLHNGDAGLRGVWEQTRRLLWRAQGGGLLATLMISLLCGNVLFYQSWAGWLGLALSGVMVWISFGVILVAMLLFPVLTHAPDLSLRRAVRQCVWLVLDNLWRIIVLALAAVACLIAGAVSGAGLALGAVPATLLGLNLGLAATMQRYGGSPLERDPRGLKDVLRPWQS